MDYETEELIQKTLRQHFQHATTISIAHKIQTIMDSDRVMVFENGELKEFDSPSQLLANRDSFFSQLVQSVLKVGDVFPSTANNNNNNIR